MRKFGRTRGPRKLFLQTLAHNLIMKGKITTTVTRAKSIRPIVERLVTIAKKQTLADFRRLLSALPKASAEKLYYDIAPKYKERKGGYLRIMKATEWRKRDAVDMAIVEFV